MILEHGLESLETYCACVSEASIQSTRQDVRILAIADEIHSNDELLRTVIVDSVSQIRPAVKDVFELVASVAVHRLPEWPSLPASQQLTLFDPARLTRDSREAAMHMIEDALHRASLIDLRGICDIPGAAALILSFSICHSWPRPVARAIA